MPKISLSRSWTSGFVLIDLPNVSDQSSDLRYEVKGGLTWAPRKDPKFDIEYINGFLDALLASAGSCPVIGLVGPAMMNAEHWTTLGGFHQFDNWVENGSVLVGGPFRRIGLLPPSDRRFLGFRGRQEELKVDHLLLGAVGYVHQHLERRSIVVVSNDRFDVERTSMGFDREVQLLRDGIRFMQYGFPPTVEDWSSVKFLQVGASSRGALGPGLIQPAVSELEYARSVSWMLREVLAPLARARRWTSLPEPKWDDEKLPVAPNINEESIQRLSQLVERIAAWKNDILGVTKDLEGIVEAMQQQIVAIRESTTPDTRESVRPRMVELSRRARGLGKLVVKLKSDRRHSADHLEWVVGAEVNRATQRAIRAGAPLDGEVEILIHVSQEEFDHGRALLTAASDFVAETEVYGRQFQLLWRAKVVDGSTKIPVTGPEPPSFLGTFTPFGIVHSPAVRSGLIANIVGTVVAQDGAHFLVSSGIRVRLVGFAGADRETGGICSCVGELVLADGCDPEVHARSSSGDALVRLRLHEALDLIGSEGGPRDSRWSRFRWVPPVRSKSVNDASLHRRTVRVLRNAAHGDLQDVKTKMARSEQPPLDYFQHLSKRLESRSEQVKRIRAWREQLRDPLNRVVSILVRSLDASLENLEETRIQIQRSLDEYKASLERSSPPPTTGPTSVKSAPPSIPRVNPNSTSDPSSEWDDRVSAVPKEVTDDEDKEPSLSDGPSTTWFRVALITVGVGISAVALLGAVLLLL